MAWLVRVVPTALSPRENVRYIRREGAEVAYTTDNPLEADRFDTKEEAETVAFTLMAGREWLFRRLKPEWRLGQWPPEA